MSRYCIPVSKFQFALRWWINFKRPWMKVKNLIPWKSSTILVLPYLENIGRLYVICVFAIFLVFKYWCSAEFAYPCCGRSCSPNQGFYSREKDLRYLGQKWSTNLRNRAPYVCLYFLSFVLEFVPRHDADFKKMTVKELKQTLSYIGVECNGCMDKSDFIEMAEKNRDRIPRVEL